MVVAQATYDPTSVLPGGRDASIAICVCVWPGEALAIHCDLLPPRCFTTRRRRCRSTSHSRCVRSWSLVPCSPAPPPSSSSRPALAAGPRYHRLRAFSWRLLLLLLLRDYRLIPQPAADLLLGLAVAFAVAGFGRGVAVALFAPGRSFRRLIPWADQAADLYAAHLSWGAGALGVTIFLNALHRASGAPLAPVIATWALFALAFVVIAMHLLRRSAQIYFRSEDLTATGARLPWLRVLLWPIAIAVAISLVAGYVGFAAFLAVRLLAVLAIGGALTVALVFVDAFDRGMASDTPRGRRMAAVFGVTPNALDLLTAARLRGGAARPDRRRGAATGRLFRAVRRRHRHVFQVSRWDFSLGGIDLAPSNIFAALAILLIGLVVVRGAQRWLETRFLPRTRLDSGLQNSIAALTGYSAADCRPRARARRARHRPAEDRADRRCPVGRYRLRPAIGGIELRVRPHPARRAADPGRRLGGGEERGGLGAPHQCARHRDRDVRPRERHHPQPRASSPAW